MNKINKKTTIYIIIITIIVVIIYYFFIRKEDYLENDSNLNILNLYEENIQMQNDVSNLESNNEISKIVVYITGAVKNEGVYEIKENSRIVDVIEKSGGLTEDANINNINLAYILQDGMKIHIPKKDENVNDINDDTHICVSTENEVTKETKGAERTSKTNKININTATQTELESLPGIGSSTATKIIAYRKEKGKFNKIEDIKEVSGIGESKYSQIKDLIIV